MKNLNENLSWARTYRPTTVQKLAFWVALLIYPAVCLYRLVKRQVRIQCEFDKIK